MAKPSASDDTPVSEETLGNEAEAEVLVPEAESTEAQETEVDPDDIELSDEDLEAAGDDEETKEEEAGDESQGSEEAEEKPEEQSEEETEAESTDEESSEEVTPSEDKSPARTAWEQREARRQADKSNQQEQYIDAAEDEKDLALRQLQVDAYNNKVEGNINKLQNGIDKAIAGIDLFKTGTPEQKERLLREVDKFEALHVRKDRNGDPVEVTGNIYTYLQEEADSIRRLTGVGARQQVRDKSKTKAKTLTPPASKPKPAEVDPDVEAFDAEAERW